MRGSISKPKVRVRKLLYSSNKTLEENLVGNGIDITDSIINSIITGLTDTYTDSQLFDICIEYKNNPYTPYINENYLYEDDIECDMWVKRETTYILNSKDNQVFNDPVIIEELKTAVNLSNTKIVMYHVTSWRGANNIINNGVDLDKSRACLDFGQGKRFYLSPNEKTVTNYAEKKSELFQNEIAILFYSVPKSVINETNLRQANDSWKNLIRYSRRSKKVRVNYDIERQRFIYGLMCSNPNAVIQTNTEPVPHKSKMFQLAVNKEGLNEIELLGVLFYNKSVKVVECGDYDEDCRPTFDQLNEFFVSKWWRKLKKGEYRKEDYPDDWFVNHIFDDIVSSRFRESYKQFGEFDKALKGCGVRVKLYRELVKKSKLDKLYNDTTKHLELFERLKILSFN